MTGQLQTVSPDQLGERAAPSDELFSVVFAPGGPLQKLAFRKLLAKLISTNLCKSTKALLDADLAYAADSVALVFADPVPAQNGWYRKSGAIGAGAWTQFEELSVQVKQAALAARDAALAARDAAAAQAAICEAMAIMLQSTSAGGLFDSLADGAAATVNGNTFWYIDGSGRVCIGRNVAGVGVKKAEFLTAGGLPSVLADTGTAAGIGTASGETAQAAIDRLSRGAGPFIGSIMGQSNALGVYADAAFNPYNAKVGSWDSGASAFVMGGKYDAAPWNTAPPRGNGAPGFNNIGLAAAHGIQNRTGRTSYIVCEAMGWRPISDWVGSGTASVRYAAAKAKIEAALAALGKTTLDYLIWDQGEEDGAQRRTYAQYRADLTTLVAQLRAESWIDQTTPIYIMGLSNLHDRYMPMQAARDFCAQVDSNCIYVNTNRPDATGGLRGINSDFTHYLGDVLWDFGYNRIAPMFLRGWYQPETHSPLFFERSLAPATIATSSVLATFNTLISQGSWTEGPGITETASGDGSTTVFTLTRRGDLSSIDIGATNLTPGAGFTQSGTTITFTTAPAAGANNITFNYGFGVKGPVAVNSIIWGDRCYSDATGVLVGGTQNYAVNTAVNSIVHGREINVNSPAQYVAAFGYQSTLSGKYQLVAGRGHTATVDGECTVGVFSKFTAGERLFQVGTGATSGNRQSALSVDAANKNVFLLAPTAVTEPVQTGEVTFKRISNTQLEIRMMGTDGTVRSTTLTLA